MFLDWKKRKLGNQLFWSAETNLDSFEEIKPCHVGHGVISDDHAHLQPLIHTNNKSHNLPKKTHQTICTKSILNHQNSQYHLHHHSSPDTPTPCFHSLQSSQPTNTQTLTPHKQHHQQQRTIIGWLVQSANLWRPPSWGGAQWQWDRRSYRRRRGHGIGSHHIGCCPPTSSSFYYYALSIGINTCIGYRESELGMGMGKIGVEERRWVIAIWRGRCRDTTFSAVKSQ